MSLQALCRTMMEADLQRQGGQAPARDDTARLGTGSEGFTGRYVCDEFAGAGWEVWGAGVQPKPDEPQYRTSTYYNPRRSSRLVNAPSPTSSAFGGQCLVAELTRPRFTMLIDGSATC